MNLESGQRAKSDQWQVESNRIQNSIVLWWKGYYKYSRNDERFKSATYIEILEDYLEYMILNSDTETNSEGMLEYLDWESKIKGNVGEFEKWRQETEKLIQKAREYSKPQP